MTQREPKMLSAFTAKPVVELKARDKSKIESILAYGRHSGRGGAAHRRETGC